MLCAQLPEDYQDLLDFLTWTGSGAVRELKWADVNTEEQIIRPAGGSQTKRRGVVELLGDSRDPFLLSAAS